MNSRERILKTLRFEPTDRLARDLWYLGSARLNWGAEVDRVVDEYPSDIGYPVYTPFRMPYQQGDIYTHMYYVDAWGSGWKATQPGIAGEVVLRPLEDWSALATFKPPFEVLGKGMEQVNASCAASDKFMLSVGLPRPFERMQFLRGSEKLYLDLATGSREVHQLREMVHEYFMRETEVWMKTDVDGFFMMDDWGSQRGLLISPEMWREFFKPLYKDYAELAHRHGKAVFMHSDGNIEAIYPELIEIGVDAVNSQLFCMDIEKLGRQYGGKITFWGELDRQNLLPHGTREEVEAAAQRLMKAFVHFDGGFIAQCEWGGDVPPATIRTAYAAFDRLYPQYRPVAKALK